MDKIQIKCMVVFSLIGSVISQTCVSPTTSCNCFVDEHGKKIINCRYKRLTQIPTFTATGIIYDEIIFQSTEETGQCMFDCNNITTLNINAFSNLKVRKIDLRNNPLSNVNFDAFGNLVDHLQELLIEGNGQVDPPYNAIAVLENLQTLHLENYISSRIQIPDAILPLPRLRSLTLKKWKNLQTLDSKVFSIMSGLTSFKLLNLPSMIQLPVSTIQSFHHLMMIEVTDTGIQSIPAGLFNPIQPLTDVTIQHNNNIQHVDDKAFTGITDTAINLDLVENRITNLRFLSSGNWTKLKELNIAYNYHIGTIPTGIFQTTPFITNLQCQDIGLTEVNEDMFLNLPNLHLIELSYNNIQNVQAGAFRNSPNLSELYLGRQDTKGTFLKFHENAFNGIESMLKVLSLNDNKLILSQAWNEIQKLTNLETLELENVGITNIPNMVFVNNTKLQSINLSNNNISTINQQTFYGPINGLKYIDLNNNKITTIDSCVLNDFSTKPTLYLSGNPLHCDCNLVWLYDWLYAGQSMDTVYTLGSCVTPPPLAYKYFDQFTRTDMCPRSPSTHTCQDLLSLATTTSSMVTMTTETPTTITTTISSIRLFVDNVGVSAFQAHWQIPVSDITNAVGYELEIISFDTTNTVHISNVDVRSYTFVNLRPGNTYTLCFYVLYTGRKSDLHCISVKTTRYGVTTMKTTEPGVIVG
ncbi:Leucine rich repeat containing 32 [Mactra antiquata]